MQSHKRPHELSDKFLKNVSSQKDLKSLTAFNLVVGADQRGRYITATVFVVNRLFFEAFQTAYKKGLKHFEKPDG